MTALALTPIGVIRSEYRAAQGVPVQPTPGRGTATVEVFSPFRAGLVDLDGFERIWLVYQFHLSRSWSPMVTPFLDAERSRGVFATRAPSRPCPIGLSSVRLLGVDIRSGVLNVSEVDVVDGAPLLDIKPYVPGFDAHPRARAGWLDGRDQRRPLSDGRFSE